MKLTHTTVEGLGLKSRKKRTIDINRRLHAILRQSDLYMNVAINLALYEKYSKNQTRSNDSQLLLIQLINN